MEQASLAGLDAEGTALILTVPGGKKVRLPIDDALRAAIRSDRPGFERARADESSLRPRDIQAKVRAGTSPEELSEDYGLDLGFIMRYAAPVMDERAYFAEQAAALPVTHDFDAPPINELIPERLEAAQLPETDVSYDAWRGEEGWVLAARFGEGQATWLIQLADKTAEPLDELSRRIVTGEPIGPLLGRHLAAVQDDGEPGPTPLPMHPSFQHPSMGPSEPDPANLLTELDEARGVRVEMHLADDPFDPGEPPAERDLDADIVSLSHARTPYAPPEPPPGTTVFPPEPGETPGYGADAPLDPGTGTPGRSAYATDDAGRDLPTVPLPADDGPEYVPGGAAPAGPGVPSVPGVPGDPGSPDDDDPQPPVKPPTKPGRSKRASVPSWDEIVFGAKPE